MKTRFKIFTTILSVLACFVGLPEIKAAPQVAPPPDGCYPGFTTAEGCLALQKLITGTGNTGVGWRSLFSVGRRQLQHRCWRWNAGPQYC